jgi:hypothetical protein
MRGPLQGGVDLRVLFVDSLRGSHEGRALWAGGPAEASPVAMTGAIAATAVMISIRPMAGPPLA